jgi:putative membrane protein
MKKRTLKKFLFGLTVTAAVFIGTSCNNNTSQGGDSAKEAAKENNDKFDNKKLENDAQFLVDATASSLCEIQLGELAQQKGSSDSIRVLGKMMVTSHTKLLKEIRDLAKKKQITIPDSATAKAQATYNDLNGKAGADFDKAYCSATIDGHKDAIAKFEKEGSDSRDGELKDWATTTLPNLRKHLDHVFACQKTL